MQLTMREVASHLGVEEATVRRWISQRALPVHHAHEQLYSNPMELWEWALENGITVSRRLLDEARLSADDIPPLRELLSAGGIFHDLDGNTKAKVLREFVNRLPLSPEQDRSFLVSVLEAREALGSTGIGDGIAIPHVRNPIILHVDAPFLSLGLLKHPVEFDAIDGKPVHALFMVVSPTVPAHLKILARLGFVLRDDVVRELIGRQATADEILQRVDFIESTRTTASFRAVGRP